jgi:hypothetical protein
VRGCITCKKNKIEHLHHAGLLQPLGVLSAIWADISMDFIKGFHKINGKSVILTVVDRFSKAAHFITLGHPYTVTTVARAFFIEIIRLHGILSSIISDHDPTFTSNFWQELFKLSGVRLQMSLAFHPQFDGPTEVVNKIITMYLRCLTGDRPRQWLQWLPWAEFCYNSTYQSSLRTSPFRVVFGRDPPPLARTSRARRAFRRWLNNWQSVMSSSRRSVTAWNRPSNTTNPTTTRSTETSSSRCTTRSGSAF